MKIHQSTKEQNYTWAMIYLGLSAAMVVYASWKNEPIFFLFGLVMMGLGIFRWKWLAKRLVT